ncbi:dihydrofolate reductase [Salipaludibacillus keqinensis]|uniref:Dihydrofolate reductase n=1 Tax=Salipaludibacillus keqinensis TaxID=2045207 RepID=A0A323TH54_9BACI|nr:dihydrofolate reductase [Salipaludibacillus keqinensis]PYZ92907.1 dihydrofolate reductase [Salipaludibacillus keqinensis]
MISMIAAFSKGRVIGKDGEMPWHLPADLKHFKNVTSGHPVLMGRKTFESIGRPLPKRQNIVLTRDKDFTSQGIEVIHDFSEVDPLMADEKEFFVIGGATIYEQLMKKAERLYITEIEATFEGDTHFPPISDLEWKVVSSEKGIVDEKNPYPHTFIIYERI